MIERISGVYQGRNKSTAYKDLVWTVATAKDTKQNIEQQTASTLQIIEENLNELGSNKSLIVSAQIFIANMQHKQRMDKVWCDWIGSEPNEWPQRACLGVDLEGDVLIEVTVTAVKKVARRD